MPSQSARNRRGTGGYRGIFDFSRACFAGDADDATRELARLVRSRGGGVVCLTNTHLAVTALRDDSVGAALSAASLRLPDGAPIAWAIRRTGRPTRRIAGVEMMESVFRAPEARGWRHCLFGGSSDVLEVAARRLRSRFPDIELVAQIAPPFDKGGQFPPAVLDEVVAAEADIVWCFLGAPKQERWMQENRDALAPAVLVGVGAAVDFISGRKARAPRWMQENYLEWLFRLAREPRRLMRRYLGTNSRFLALVMRELATREHRREGGAGVLSEPAEAVRGTVSLGPRDA